MKALPESQFHQGYGRRQGTCRGPRKRPIAAWRKENIRHFYNTLHEFAKKKEAKFTRKTHRQFLLSTLSTTCMARHLAYNSITEVTITYRLNVLALSLAKSANITMLALFIFSKTLKMTDKYRKRAFSKFLPRKNRLEIRG